MMKEATAPLILEIKGNSLDDGPGIRSVIFFKGCPLSCVWCHNPESKKAVQEISFDAQTCIGCGACREVCPECALSTDNRFYIDRDRCTLCFQCVDVCPAGALDRVGSVMSVDDILKRILPDKVFFDTSGGGVTLSGGEPTLFTEFSSQLLKTLKHEGIHTLMETCGMFDFSSFMEKLYPYLDTVYFDIKLISGEQHRRHCGVDNKKILENFKALHRAALQNGKRLLPRTPLIPDITDTKENIEEIAAFLKSLKVREAALLAYNPLWHDKSDKVGVDNPFKTRKTMISFSGRDVFERCKAIYARAGIMCC